MTAERRRTGPAAAAPPAPRPASCPRLGLSLLPSCATLVPSLTPRTGPPGTRPLGAGGVPAPAREGQRPGSRASPRSFPCRKRAGRGWHRELPADQEPACSFPVEPRRQAARARNVLVTNPGKPLTAPWAWLVLAAADRDGGSPLEHNQNAFAVC